MTRRGATPRPSSRSTPHARARARAPAPNARPRRRLKRRASAIRGGRACDDRARMSSGFAIAHVSPYPWEAEDNAVNAHIREVTAELARRGHRVVVLAPSRSQERVRASRRELRAARAHPEQLLSGVAAGNGSGT